GAVAQVPIGDGEIELLAELFEAFAARPELRAVVGAAGRRHVEQQHALPAAVGAWREALARSLDTPWPAPAVPPLGPGAVDDPRVALAAGLAADLADLDLDRTAPEALPMLAAELAELGWEPR